MVFVILGMILMGLAGYIAGRGAGITFVDEDKTGIPIIIVGILIWFAGFLIMRLGVSLWLQGLLS